MKTWYLTASRATRSSTVWLIVVAAMVLAGCTATQQRWSQAQHQVLDLKPGDLEAGGIAFLTPFTVTGQEEDRQPLALAFV